MFLQGALLLFVSLRFRVMLRMVVDRKKGYVYRSLPFAQC